MTRRRFHFGRREGDYSMVLLDLLHAERERIVYREALERICRSAADSAGILANTAILEGSRIADKRWDEVRAAAER